MPPAVELKHILNNKLATKKIEELAMMNAETDATKGLASIEIIVVPKSTDFDSEDTEERSSIEQTWLIVGYALAGFLGYVMFLSVVWVILRFYKIYFDKKWKVPALIC